MSATKQRRTTTTTRTSRTYTSGSGGAGGSSSSSIHVDTDGNNSSYADISSPLSPTRLSRVQEKEALSGLNDRLASYIDRVRQLESENNRLTVQIRDVEVIEKREKSNIRAAYEAELSDTRRLLDETSKQKAKIQIEADKARAEFDDLKAKIARLEKELKASETGRLNSDSLVQDLQARVNTAENRRKHAEDEAKKLRADNEALEKQLQTARRQLEEETLLRVDLENRLQSLREELGFQKQLYEKELEETRRKRQIEMTTISKELETEYQSKLQEQLRQMRANFDAQIAYNRREVEEMYDGKLRDAQDYAQRNSATAAEAREELASYRSRYNELENSYQDHQNVIDGLNKKIKDLESQLRFVREDYGNRLNSRDQEIAKLREEIQRMLIEYQDLMDTKIQLDVELAAYQKLLEGEEHRLHLTPASSPASHHTVSSDTTTTTTTGSARRGLKRKRVLQESDERYDYAESQMYKTTAGADGDIDVEEHDTDGMFIRIRNKGEEDVVVGGMYLKSVANGKEVSYKFHARQSVKPGKTITIWSSNSNATHSPPHDLVMKNQQWPTGDSIRSFLVDADGEELAWRESKRGVGLGSGYGSGYATGIEGAEDPDQRCSVM